MPNTSTITLTTPHTGLTNDHQSGSITTIYSSLQGGSKKRKLSQDSGTPGTGTGGNSSGSQQQNLVHVKQEPGDLPNFMFHPIEINKMRKERCGINLRKTSASQYS